MISSEVAIVGKSVTRDSIKENERLLEPAIRLLGMRVSVPTCQVHIRELYNYMELDCPSNLIDILANQKHIQFIDFDDFAMLACFQPSSVNISRFMT